MRPFLRSVGVAARDLVAATLRRAPGSSVQFGPPRQLVPDTRAWQRVHPSARLRALSEARPVTRAAARQADEPIARRFAAMRHGTIKPRFVAELPRGRFWGRGYGYIIDTDDALHGELSPCFDDFAPAENRPHHDALRQPLLPRLQRHRGTLAVLSTLFCENFHHWLLDAVPKLGLLHEAGWPLDRIDGFVLPASAQRPWHEQTLARLGIARDRLVFADARTHVAADTLLVPSYAEPGREPEKFDYTPEGLAFVRELFGESRDASGTWPEKIVISRELAAARRWTGGESGHAQLQRAGFAKVLLERHTLAEQAALFAHARQIVMPTGGGLANLAFCAPGTQVVELFPPTYLPTFSLVLSSALALDYTALVGPAESGATDRDSDAHPVAVPVDRILASFR
ncbi:MAG: glycosyltransferase family 61 protein [Candidatus Didemnitutus sp.]|nr:glycosyltransferase family 61 protein [Candidatus Didemnitutus sp.]